MPSLFFFNRYISCGILWYDLPIAQYQQVSCILDVIFGFLVSKNIPREMFNIRGYFNRSYLGKCSTAFLKNGKLTCPNQDFKCWLGHAQCQFLTFYKCHKIWTAWSQRLVFSEFSWLYDTYHWWKFQKSPWSKDDTPLMI